MKRLRRTVFFFFVITVFVLIVGFVYTLFGRGVTSDAMSHAYFYPLFLGVLPNALLLPIQKRLPFVGTVGYRLYSNIYNAGIGTLTVYSILLGILEIAGTDSNILSVLHIVGWIVVGIGLAVLILLLFKVRKALIRQSKSATQRRVHPN